MRVWTKKSACVVLAWSALLIIMVTAGMSRSHQAQANTRIASSTSTGITLADTVSVAAVSAEAASPAARYAVQPGDTLSGIAGRLSVRGGWPALYAANRSLIGSDPDVIRPGTVLVLPGITALTRYVVAPGDTLAAIAAALSVRGGWPVLYAANRRVIGADPDVIRPGTVLALPHQAARPSSRPNPGHRVSPRPPSASAGSGHRPGPAKAPASGMPSWLTTLLLAAGLLIGAAFLAEPVLAVRRRRSAVRAAQAGQAAAALPSSALAGQDEAPASKPAEGKTRIVEADYDRVVVTHSTQDGMVYLLRPPGAPPAEMLRAARLVLPENPYRELAAHLGLPASWPIMMADYDRVVVTHSALDGTVCVLRPPGGDPGEILRAARLVLPEGSYGELADQLGVPASWPME